MNFSQTSKRTLLAAPCLLICLSITLVQTTLAQQPDKPLQLGKIEVVGLERYTQEQVIKESGLQIGQPIDIPAADEAASRLMSSGLFKKLSYRFRASGGQAVVTFEVEEAKASAPVVFDNFVWFKEDELNAAIRREVPTYDGTAPEAGDLTDKITRALQQLLNERKIQGRVEYNSNLDLQTGKLEHLYSVKGAKIPICSLDFPGTVDVKESELLTLAQPLLGQTYSADEVKTFVRVNLLPLYRQRAHLKASFLDPVVALQTEGDCRNGVNVTLQVDEGSIYAWERAEWTGNAALSARELSAALGMKQNERADGLKIEKALRQVSEAYGRRGYLAVKFSVQPELDDSNRRVIYHYTVTEGPQFRMGELVLNGFSEAEANRFKEYWKLLPGEVFDTSYLTTFIENNMRLIFTQGTKARKIKSDYKLDRQKATVDVVIDLVDEISGV